jgi:hypothetical protein
VTRQRPDHLHAARWRLLHVSGVGTVRPVLAGVVRNLASHRDTRRVGVLGLFRTRRTSVDQPNQGSPSSREPFRCTSTARAIPANGEKSRSEKSPASLRREASPSTFCGLFANVVAGQQRELAAGWRDSGGGTRHLIVSFECASAAYMRPDRERYCPSSGLQHTPHLRAVSSIEDF